MTIDEDLSIIKDNIADYGQTNITQEEYDMIYNKAIDEFVNEIKKVPTSNLYKSPLEIILLVAEQLKGE